MATPDPLFPELSDADLVRRAQAGNLAAFEALTQRHEQRVYGLAMRMLRQEHDAEELTQQTFLSVLEHLDGRERLHDVLRKIWNEKQTAK